MRDYVGTLRAIANKRFEKGRYLLGDRDLPIEGGRVNLAWWKPRGGETRQNLGDWLSPFVVSWMLSKRGLSLDTPVNRTLVLDAVGSIIDYDFNDSVVWGSGLKNGVGSGKVMKLMRKLDIRAVRGPDTAAALRRFGYTCPDTYGDPAILVPLIVKADAQGAGDECLFVYHMHDYPQDGGENAVSMLTDDCEGLIRRIARARRVVSTSLHGIILAECYGVPAVLLAGGRADYSTFKYADWYHSTGRDLPQVATSAEEALELETPPTPDLEGMRTALMDAFPYDLWG